jgi:hypothetical protein
MSSGASVSRLSFSFRPPDPERTAAELLAEIRDHGGRVYRMQAPDRVFCLTDDVKLAESLVQQGAKPFAPPNADQGLSWMPGAYQRARDSKVEYDVWVHTIPTGDHSLWEELS